MKALTREIEERMEGAERKQKKVVSYHSFTRK